MIYSIKLNLLSILRSYKILDQKDNVIYFTKKKLFQIPRRSYIFDYNGVPLVLMKKRFFSIMSRYDIFIREEYKLTIKRNFTYLSLSLSIFGEEDEYEINGDIYKWDFTISRNQKIIAVVSKKLSNSPLASGIKIKDNNDDLLCLAILVVIKYISKNRFI